jgi:hypothetical protein
MIILSKAKSKERIMKAARTDSRTKRASVRLTTDFSLETMGAGRQWGDTFQLMKEKYL